MIQTSITMKNSAVLLLMFILSPILPQSAIGNDLSSLEGQAIKESRTVGTGLGAILGAGAGIALARNGSDSQKIAAAIAGAAIGSQIGKGAGQKAGEKRVAKTRQSFVDRSRAEARLRSARQFNSSLTSYNQSLGKKITQMKSSKSKLGVKTAIAQAKKKQSEATKQAVTLQNYAKTLPAAEASQVRATASEIQQSAATTSSLLAEVRKVEAGIY
jgi:predicted RNase H-like nuclease (RuvC/YqgF family)